MARDLRVLILVDDEIADQAYQNLENTAESQGHIFECAPPVVAVIMAALADRTVPAANLAPVLDLLGRILAGYPDESEVAEGRGDLRDRCYSEALRGYWLLMRIACARDQYNAWRIASSIAVMLDEKRSRAILTAVGESSSIVE